MLCGGRRGPGVGRRRACPRREAHLAGLRVDPSAGGGTPRVRSLNPYGGKGARRIYKTNWGVVQLQVTPPAHLQEVRATATGILACASGWCGRGPECVTCYPKSREIEPRPNWGLVRTRQRRVTPAMDRNTKAGCNPPAVMVYRMVGCTHPTGRSAWAAVPEQGTGRSPAFQPGANLRWKEGGGDESRGES